MTFEEAMKLAIAKAQEFEGRTSPNPPVGAVILDQEGRILSAAAHERAGEAHAEILALSKLAIGQKPHTLVVTLEPCHHQGKTPPCTRQILSAGVKRVVVGVEDPNLRVPGGGMRFLQEQGVEVLRSPLQRECLELIAGFWTSCRLKRPFIVVKTVWTEAGSMIPPKSQKTFSSDDSLLMAHRLRKSSDAILTGSGTILQDDPLFTVRHLKDFSDKRRDLIFLDRRKRVPAAWKERQLGLGFELIELQSLEDLKELWPKKNYLKLLVEAGPSLSTSILESDLWDLHVRVQVGKIDQIDYIPSEAYKLRLNEALS